MRRHALGCMGTRLVGAGVGMLLSMLAPSSALAVGYVLVVPPSAFEVGCMGPCACPVQEQPTYGSFQLVRTGVDPLYEHYAVLDYLASFNDGPGAVAITGSGTWDVGGEVAYLQRMQLDLSVQGAPVQHFDSGWVPLSEVFPRLMVSCAVNGFACYDSVVTVSSQPAGSTDADAFGPDAGLSAAAPNPFRAATDVRFAIAAPGPVDLDVLDLQGRRVRVLLSATRLDAGPHAVRWDGRRDDGRAAPAGLYWLRMRWGGRVDGRRLLRIE